MGKLTTLLFSIVLIFNASAFSQSDGFTIDGHIEGLEEQTVVLKYNKQDTEIVDSVKAENGQFQFTGNVSYPTRGVIFTGQDKHFTIFLESSEITVKGHADSLSEVDIEGSKVQDQYERYQNQLAGIDKQMQRLRKKYMKAKKEGESERLEELRDQLISLQNKKSKQNEKFVKNNPNSFISLQKMRRMIFTSDYDEVSTLYANLSEELKSYPLGKELGKLIEAKKQTQVGKQAPGFTLDNVEGEPVSLDSYRGGYVLVDFWAHWCGPCRKEHPNYVSAYKKYRDQNFSILSISLDKSQEEWEKAIKEDNLTWTQVSSLEGFKCEVATKYAVRAIPQNFLLNPEGEIIAKNLRGDELEEKLEEIFS